MRKTMRYLRAPFVPGTWLESHRFDALIRHKHPEGISPPTLKLELVVVPRVALPFHELLGTRRKARLVSIEKSDRRLLNPLRQVFQHTPQIGDITAVSFRPIRLSVEIPFNGNRAVARRPGQPKHNCRHAFVTSTTPRAAMHARPPPRGGSRNHSYAETTGRSPCHIRVRLNQVTVPSPLEFEEWSTLEQQGVDRHALIAQRARCWPSVKPLSSRVSQFPIGVWNPSIARLAVQGRAPLRLQNVFRFARRGGVEGNEITPEGLWGHQRGKENENFPSLSRVEALTCRFFSIMRTHSTSRLWVSTPAPPSHPPTFLPPSSSHASTALSCCPYTPSCRRSRHNNHYGRAPTVSLIRFHERKL